MRFLWLPWCMLHAVALLVAPAAGLADKPKDSPRMQAAQRHFDSGANFFIAGDYESARIEFEAGFWLSKLPGFLINLCSVAEQQNRVTDAMNYCEQYLRLRPHAKDRGEVRARLASLRRRQVEFPEPQLEAPPVPLPPPDPPPTIAKAPAPTAKAIAPLSPMPPLRLLAPPPAASLTSPPVLKFTRPAVRLLPPRPALVLLVGGAALFWAGVGCGSAALGTANQIEGGPPESELASLQQRGAALNAVAISFYVLGGAALVAGTGWLGHWLHRSRRSTETPARPPAAQ